MNNNRRSMKSFLAIALGLSIIGCGNDKKPELNKVEPVEVSIANVEEKGSSTILAGSGQINAVNSATLSTRMMGHVEKLAVKVGQKVRKGDLLISINNTDLRAKRAQVDASIAEAKVAHANAKKDYERFVNLYKESSASQKELDDMTARFEMAKARLESARQMMKEINSQFAYANIRAPFNGVVTNTFIDKGDMANPGVPLVSVETPGNFEVAAKVAENRIGTIKIGMKAEVLIKSLDAILIGEVTEWSTSAQNTGGQYLIKILLPKTKAKILSGMYASIRLRTDKDTSANTFVTVPTKALVNKGQLSGIYTISQDNTALLRWLRLGDIYGDSVEVLSGLSKEEKYIISADGKLYNGVKVTVQ